MEPLTMMVTRLVPPCRSGAETASAAAMDFRVMQMLEAHEGWFTDRFEDDLVANQGEYTSWCKNWKLGSNVVRFSRHQSINRSCTSMPT